MVSCNATRSSGIQPRASARFAKRPRRQISKPARSESQRGGRLQFYWKYQFFFYTSRIKKSEIERRRESGSSAVENHPKFYPESVRIVTTMSSIDHLDIRGG